MLNKQKILDFKKLLENDFLNILEKYKKEYNDFFFNMSINRPNYDFGYFSPVYSLNHQKINKISEDTEINSLIKFIYTQVNEEVFNLKVCFELNELLGIKFEKTLIVLILEQDIEVKSTNLNNNSIEDLLRSKILEENFINLINDKINEMVTSYNKSKNIEWLKELNQYNKQAVINRTIHKKFLDDTRIIRYLSKKSFIHFKNTNNY